MLQGLHFAVLLEEHTNPLEYHYSRLRLSEAGATVTVIGLDRLEYRLEDHSLAQADAVIADAARQVFDGVLIPGGLGPEKLRQNEKIVELVKDCHARGMLCAAICHGQQVLISAGLMRGVRATAAWSMQDDLRLVGATVPEGVRAVRDGQIVTAIFPHDLPEFFQLVFQAVSESTGRQQPEGYPKRFSNQTWGIVADDASDSTQVYYASYRIKEDGGTAILLGRRAGRELKLSNVPWEWGAFGLGARVERALPDPGVTTSCDTEAEMDSAAISPQELDGLLLPGGLGTWMIRGHPGLQALIRDVYAAGKPIGAIERGPKLLAGAGILDGREITCAPQMRDDVIHAVADIRYRDEPIVHDDNLLTCQGTEDLPAFMRTLLSQYGQP